MNSVLGAQDRASWRWVTIESGPVVVANAAFGFHFRVLLTENAVFEPPLNGVNGQRILLRIEQDTTGGRTLTPNTAGIIVKGSVTEDTTAGAVAFWELVYDEIAAMWEVWSLTASSASGANTALSNLASVAVNTTLVSDTDNTDDLGTSSSYWRQVFVGDTIAMKNATKIQANGGSSGTIYFDTAAIHLSFSAKPVSLWTGTFLGFDAAVSLGSTPGTTGFGMSGANFECKYTGTVAWRLESATTMFLNDCNLKLSATTGTKIGTTTAQKLGFWNATPVAQDTGWVDTTNHTDKKTLDESTGTLADALNMLGTIQRTLKTYGLLGG